MPPPPPPPPFVPDLARLESAERVFSELTELHSLALGKDLSAAEREGRGIADGAMHSLVYGETPFRSLGVILQRVQHLLGVRSFASAVFLDLGAGTGKPVLAAALLHRWAECRGIELVEGLHAASLELLERWEDGLPYLPAGERRLRHRIPAAARATPVRLLRGDVLELDWSDVDVAFACSTCFDAELMARVSRRAEALRPGSVVVTCSDALSSPRFGLLEEVAMTMSWGPCTVYIQQRMHDDDVCGGGGGGGGDGVSGEGAGPLAASGGDTALPPGCGAPRQWHPSTRASDS